MVVGWQVYSWQCQLAVSVLSWITSLRGAFRDVAICRMSVTDYPKSTIVASSGFLVEASRKLKSCIENFGTRKGSRYKFLVPRNSLERTSKVRSMKDEVRSMKCKVSFAKYYVRIEKIENRK